MTMSCSSRARMMKTHSDANRDEEDVDAVGDNRVHATSSLSLITRAMLPQELHYLICTRNQKRVTQSLMQ